MRRGSPALLVILALAVAAAHQMLPATLAMRATPFSHVEGENPFNHFVDVAMLGASALALVMLARRLPTSRSIDAG